MKKIYEKTKHKIKEIWDDVLALIAIENQLIERIEKLEEGVDRIQLTVTNIEKYNNFSEQT